MMQSWTSVLASRRRFAMLRNRLHLVIPRTSPRAVLAVGFPVLLLAIALTLPAQAEIYHVKLRNGTSIDTLYQPQQATWDPNVVILLSDAGNWIGIDQRTIESVENESQIRGFGVVLNFNTVAIGWAPNDAPEPVSPGSNPQAGTMQALQEIYQQQQAQSHYTVPQFVSTDETTGIPARLVGGAVLPNMQAPLPQLPLPLPAPAAPAPAPAPAGGPNQ
jgi:hypothetical protein